MCFDNGNDPGYHYPINATQDKGLSTNTTVVEFVVQVQSDFEGFPHCREEDCNVDVEGGRTGEDCWKIGFFECDMALSSS